MYFKQTVPEYIITGKNTFKQVAFAALFAFIFINIYRPFGYDSLYSEIDKWLLTGASAVVVLCGMLVIILSRLLLLKIKKEYEITYAVYIWFIIAEIILLGGFYTSLEIFVLNDERSAFALLVNAVQNTSLILLIPYTLSFLFFAWSDIRKRFEKLLAQFRNPSDFFIPFADNNGNLKISIKNSDLLFLEANDNYVIIHYRNEEKRKKIMIRNTLKTYEQKLKDYPVIRVHRRFSVNIKNVKVLKREKRNYVLIMNDMHGDKIPLSKMYETKIIKLINS
jgi:DNA-binding LytR/AlgR family response regulator